MAPVNSIRPHPKNPRQGNLQTIHQSITANGFYGTCLVQRSTGFICVGNHRYRAAVLAGAVEVPVVYLDVDDRRALKILLADNRTNDLAAYEREELLILLDAVSANGDLPGTGYDEAAVAELRESLSPPTIEDSVGVEAREASVPETTIVRVGKRCVKWPIGEFDEWYENLRQEVGFDKKSIEAEILRRLGFDGHQTSAA